MFFVLYCVVKLLSLESLCGGVYLNECVYV